MKNKYTTNDKAMNLPRHAGILLQNPYITIDMASNLQRASGWPHVVRAQSVANGFSGSSSC
jgi:hypothetical protein